MDDVGETRDQVLETLADEVCEEMMESELPPEKFWEGFDTDDAFRHYFESGGAIEDRDIFIDDLMEAVAQRMP